MSDWQSEADRRLGLDPKGMSQTVAPIPHTTEELADEIDEFLQLVYTSTAQGKIEEATDRIFDYIDRLLCQGRYAVCDEVLQRLDVEKLPTTLMRSFLTITVAAKERLHSRHALYQNIERKMIEVKGEDKTRRIIGRLAGCVPSTTTGS